MNSIFAQFGLSSAILICILQANVSAQSVINRGLAAADKQGVLEPYKDTEVATAEMGFVRELFVKLGDVIEEKAAIGRLDNEQQRFL